MIPDQFNHHMLWVGEGSRQSDAHQENHIPLLAELPKYVSVFISLPVRLSVQLKQQTDLFLCLFPLVLLLSIIFSQLKTINTQPYTLL